MSPDVALVIATKPNNKLPSVNALGITNRQFTPRNNG